MDRTRNRTAGHPAGSARTTLVSSRSSRSSSASVTPAEEAADVTGIDERVIRFVRPKSSSPVTLRVGGSRLRLRSPGGCGELEQIADGHRTEIAVEMRIEVVGIGHGLPEDPAKDRCQRPNQLEGLGPSSGIPEPVLQRRHVAQRRRQGRGLDHGHRHDGMDRGGRGSDQDLEEPGLRDPPMPARIPERERARIEAHIHGARLARLEADLRESRAAPSRDAAPTPRHRARTPARPHFPHGRPCW